MKPSILKSCFVAAAIVAPLSLDGIQAKDDLAKLESVSSAFSLVAENVTPAVVSIETYYNPTNDQQGNLFNPWQRRPRRGGSGSGVIYDSSGHIITNAHVIEGASDIEVTLSDNRRIKAELVGQDPKSDLAVLKVNDDEDLKLLTVARYGDSDKMKVGDWVIAIGNPLGFSHTVTHGIVSAKGRSGLRNDITAYEDFIQTDASINRGNSGGPLCNIRGEVIGINSMIASQNGGFQGLGFSIPINMAKRIVDQLINTGEVQRGFLGVAIKDVDQELAREFGLDIHEGALVDEVMPDTPASKAGLMQGDIVVGLNGTQIKSSTELRNRISQTSPKTKVSLAIIREGMDKKIEVVLGSLRQPKNGGDLLGLRVTPMTPQIMEQYRVDNGVMVEVVGNNSPASEAGIQPQMVITSVDHKPVLHPEDFNRLVSESLEGDDDAVLLYVNTTSKGSYLVVKIEE